MDQQALLIEVMARLTRLKIGLEIKEGFDIATSAKEARVIAFELDSSMLDRKRTDDARLYMDDLSNILFITNEVRELLFLRLDKLGQESR